MVAIKVDPDWVSGYAQRVTLAAEALSSSATALNAAPLTTESFGSLGKTVRIAESYGRAAEALRGQLDRAVASLESAAGSLTTVAEAYRVSDDDGMAELNRRGQA